MDLTKSNNLMHETAVSVELKMIVITFKKSRKMQKITRKWLLPHKI